MQNSFLSLLKFKRNFTSKIFVLSLIVFAICSKVNAQTTTDSVMVVTDTSITTTNNIVVTDSAGTTTLFAGGQQSDYGGKVGIGTNTPAQKLTIYDDQNASLLITQKMQTSTAARGIMSSTGEEIRNFDIDILEEPYPGDVYRERGSVVLSAFSGGSANIVNGIHVGSIFNNSIVMAHACAVQLDPDMSFQAKSFGWYINTLDPSTGCPTQDYDLKMVLDQAGNLTIENTYNGKALNTYDYTPSATNVKAISVSKNSIENFLVWSDGRVRAREVKVSLANPFPDYVFEKDHALMSLYELENYINSNKHLPNMPTAKEVENNGVDLGELNRKLTEKVEELTLYLIELQKQVDALKKK
jgi:hypothetical protein